MQMIFAANCLLGFSRPLLSNLPTSAKVNIPMPLPDFSGRSPSRLASVTSTGSSSVSRSTASMGTSRYRQSSKALDNRRVVRQEIICAGSIRVRSCKLLWKPAALQLMVTTTSSLGEDEAHFDNCDDDSDDSDDDDIDKVTTMAQPNETHHYSITFCHRSLMGHARREKIELNGTRDLVEIICGEDGLLSTRFEFSIAYGSVGPSGRRRTLTCRARDAKEYLQWTEALRMAVEAQGKNKSNKGIKMNRCTHSNTLTSSKAPSNSQASSDSFFDADVELEARKEPPTPTSPTAATAAKAIAPPEADIVEESALKPVPADIAAVFDVARRRQVSVVIKPTQRPANTRLQRRSASITKRVPVRHSATRASKPTAPLPRSSTPHNTRHERTQPPYPDTVRARTSSAGRPRTRVRKISLSESNRRSKRNRLRVSPTSGSEGKRPRVPSSPLASAPVLGALPMLQSPSSLTDSSLDFVDSSNEASYIDAPRTTDYVNSLVKIASIASARQRQQLLQRQRKERKSYVLPLKSDEAEDEWLMSRRTSRLNLDTCDFEDVKSARSNRRRAEKESWAAYLKAMESMKVNVYVASEGGGTARRICWYMGTSDAQVEKAIRVQLRLPRDTEFLLRDADGDVVPASSTLPNGQHYKLIVQEKDDYIMSSANTAATSIIRPIAPFSGDEVEAVPLPSPKRRRVETEDDAVTPPTPSSPLADPVPAITPPTRRNSTPPRPVATIIAQFVDTFTRPIANEDNVNFIPNAGPYALYDLYCKVVQDKKFHPKREDVFYKMTSLHCKVDRQRVNRYYMCPVVNGVGTMFVQCKPQGKGVLLRRYRKVGVAEELEDVVKAAPFVSWLGLDPNEVVVLYTSFIEGFVPITKRNYRVEYGNSFT
ncbi:hypothetical protein L915_20396 [Phytophthora nicotianae]|uniref:PH domain-containing protein n=1 Tax=Phytophthora nicotianae TaxID=4792 RepID=W2FRG7_PHYNI|nr:hypothetical protein L915_20396 [Phytophthora nicotianae]